MEREEKETRIQVENVNVMNSHKKSIWQIQHNTNMNHGIF